MKKILLCCCVILCFLATGRAGAQSFTNYVDTVYMMYAVGSGPQDTSDNIIVPSGGPNVALQWKVIACNFPTSWYPSATFCDNSLCYSFLAGGLWPTVTTKTSAPYIAADTGGFKFTIDLPASAALGTYYVTVRLNNIAIPSDTTTSTFIVTGMTLGTAHVRKPASNISLYPNPASNEINVVWDADADVKTVAIYSTIGKIMSVCRVSGNSANLKLENIPAGIYFVRLINSNGEVVATRKFTKE